MLAAKNLVKRFSSDGTETTVLDDVSLTVDQGRFVSIVGRSGSGKTTLMNVMSTLLAPDAGVVEYQGRNLARIKERDLNVLRRLDFAVIFQFHYLLPYLTALENTLLPFMASAAPVSRQLKDKARESLARVGLSTKADRLPGQLSGGEQQRVAIARALVKRARVLFADEPTGSPGQEDRGQRHGPHPGPEPGGGPHRGHGHPRPGLCRIRGPGGGDRGRPHPGHPRGSRSHVAPALRQDPASDHTTGPRAGPRNRQHDRPSAPRTPDRATTNRTPNRKPGQTATRPRLVPTSIPDHFQ